MVKAITETSKKREGVRKVFAHPFQKHVDIGSRTMKGIRIIKKLAKGAYGRVYKGTRKLDGRICALKFVDLRDEETKENYVLEFELCKLFAEADIGPKIFGDWTLPKHQLAVVAAECWSTTLDDYLHENKLKTPPKCVMKKLEEKLKKLHDTGHVHLDLHSGNVLLKLDPSGKVVTDVALTDFGKATHCCGFSKHQLGDVIKMYNLKPSSNPKRLDWQMFDKIKQGSL